MSKTLEQIEHIRAWLNESEAAGRITWTPGHKETFADLYALYRSTVTGHPIAKQPFAMALEMSTVPSVKGPANVAYRQNIKIIPAS